MWCLLLFLKAPAQRYSFQNYNTEDGLIQSQAICIAQDKLDRLWIGTAGGFSIFDGTAFKSYTRSDGLPGNTITCFAFTENNHAWIGTTEGLSYFDGLHFKSYKIGNKPEQKVIYNIQIDNENRVWVQVGLSLFLLKDSRFQEISLPDVLTSINTDKDGVLFCSYLHKGVYKFQDNQWTMVAAASAPISFLSVFFSNIQSKPYLLTSNGLAYINSGIIHPIILPSLNKISNTGKILIDRNENIWIASSNGVWMYDGKQFNHFLSTSGFTDDQCFSIFEDRSGNIWFGTNGNGLYRYSHSPFLLFNNSQYPFARNVINIFEDKENLLHISTTNNGIFTFNTANLQYSKDMGKPLSSPIISAFHDTALGAFYATIFNGVWNVKNNKATLLKFPANTGGIEDISSWKKWNNQVWSISGKGLYRIQANTAKLVVNESGYKSFEVLDSSRLIIGKSQGVFIYHSATNSFSTLKGLELIRAQCMKKYGDTLFLGTEDRGLIVYDLTTKKNIYINQEKGLSCNYVYNLLIDKSRNLWTGTGCGIDKINFKNNDFTITSYGKYEGLRGAESNTDGSFMDSKGDLWFGTTKGLFLYNYDNKKVNTVIPKVLLTNVLLFSKELSASDISSDSLLPYYKLPYHPVLEHHQNNLTFSFHAVSFLGADRIKYLYKLEGADPNFMQTQQTSVVYPNLPPGKYTFIVYASDEDGNWHENAVRYRFTIKAVFYQTNKFIFLMGALAILLLSGLIYFILKRKEANRKWEQRLREEEQSKVRQRTAEDFHDEIGNKITRINLLTMMAERKAKNQPEITNLLSQIRHNTQSLYLGSKDIIWSLQTESNYLKEALLRIQQNAANTIEGTGIRLHFNDDFVINDDIKMPLDYSRNLILIFKEAINNAIKYAHAENLYLNFHEDIDSTLILELIDDGTGFDFNEITKGNGLKNIQKRAEKLKGKISILSDKNVGTTVRLRLFKYSFKT